ncbi:MAG: UDP-glucose 6-dehydrogenase [Microgenomates group bacterium GW2011_GWF2_47_9]|nr:MAG: UDP-glucose 6-dehydrogenase [Microgenomates group bacterium GW2011_GWF2_47_9]
MVMKIACIGTGFVGVVTSAVLAKLGHTVAGLDIDEKKIASLTEGKVPFYEPGLEELILSTISSQNLTFTSNYELAISGADIVMIMVGTPSAADGQADLSYVYKAAESSAPHLKEGAIVVIKSTVPPGTNAKVSSIISGLTKVDFDIASVPEFLKEGTAVEDTLHPDRIVIGATNPKTIETLKELHKPLTDNIIVVSPESAQMAKYSANVYLAMRITFANQIADLCEKNGADVDEVLRGIGADKRIGSHYWYPGLGYGGSCFPKDVKEIAAYAKSVGEAESIFIAVDDRNENRIEKMMQKFDKFVNGFAGKSVAILGLSFKPNTNDTRVAPALKVIPWLIDHGAKVTATDPKAIEEIKPHLPGSVLYSPSANKAINGAQVVMILVEWDEYKSLDFRELVSSMSKPSYLIDTRNLYTKDQIEGVGIAYRGIGK